MENSCPILHINSDFLQKLEIFKILLNQYNEEIYQDILQECINKNYLRIKSDNNKNGSDRDRLRDNL